MLALLLTLLLQASTPHLTGTLEVIQEDGPTPTLHHLLKTDDDKHIELHFKEGKPPKIKHGTRVQLVGSTPITEALDVTAIQAVATPTVAQSPAVSTTGPQRTLLIIVTFTDNPTPPTTVADATRILFTEVNAFYQAASFGATSIVGDVVGPLQIPLSMTSTCDQYHAGTLALAAAKALGVNVDAYAHIGYNFPAASTCTYWGLGTVGGTPSNFWINGNLQMQVVAHELGHNFGLQHAHGRECTVTPLAAPCAEYEYGDTEIMGGDLGDFNTFHKIQLGWLNAPGFPTTTTVTSSGTYHLDAYAGTGTTSKSLIIPTPDGNSYTVEYRAAVGVDATPYPISRTGVEIHTLNPAAQSGSFLLDMHPGSAGSLNDAALLPQVTFRDPVNLISITPLSVNEIAVTIGSVPPPPPPSCVVGRPTFTFPTPSQTVAGGTLLILGSVQNTSTSLCAPAPTTIIAIGPAGWTVRATPQTVTIPAQASIPVSLSVTIPTGAPLGSSTLMVGAYEPGAAPGVANPVVAITQIQPPPPPPPPCVLSAPLVKLQPQTAPFTVGGTGMVQGTVQNTNSPGCPPAPIGLSVIGPSGWTTTPLPSTFVLAPSGTGMFTLSAAVPAMTPTGAYALIVSASQMGSALVGTTGAQVFVYAGPPPGLPLLVTLVKHLTVTWTAQTAPLATLVYTITAPDGTITTVSSTADATGQAITQWVPPLLTGTYHVAGVATIGIRTSPVATLTFTVN